MRATFLGVVVVLVLLVVGAIGAVTYWVWFHVHDSTKRLAEIADVGIYGALLLAALAAVVAAFAFALASRRPRLDAEIVFRDSDPNDPVLPYVRPVLPGTQMIPLDPTTADLTARIMLINKRKFSARNPSVRVALVGFTGLRMAPGWTAIRSPGSVTLREVTWDGNGSVQDVRALPDLDFAGVSYLANDHEYRIDIHLAAEGFRKTLHVPVTLKERSEWNRWMATNSYAPPPG